ncbi:MAG: DNA repair protein RecO [Thermodesulfobacteriota bacterium]
MARHETEALVLKIFDHGESDKIITFFTLDLGKITAIAKGAKRSKKRFVGKLELFNHLNIVVADNKYSSLMRVDEAELLNPFPALRANYGRFVCSTLVCELILGWTADHDRDDNIFQLLAWTYNQLTTSKPIPTLLLFQLHLLTLLGFHLHLSSCAQCGAQVSNRENFVFVSAKNGVICSKCFTGEARDNTSVQLSLGTIKILEKARELSADKWPRLHFSKQSLKEAIALFQNHNSFLLQRDILSWKELQGLSPSSY